MTSNQVLTRDELFAKNVGFADKVARCFTIFGMTVDDHLQEGRLFLLELLAKHPDAEPALIKVATRNHLISLYRKSAAVPEMVSLDVPVMAGDDELSYDEVLPHPGPSPEKLRAAAQERELLYKAIDRLTGADRQIIRMHLDELTVREIAERLSLSKSAVSRRLVSVVEAITAAIQSKPGWRTTCHEAAA